MDVNELVDVLNRINSNQKNPVEEDTETGYCSRGLEPIG